MPNINMYKGKLEEQKDKFEFEKEKILKQIELLSWKKNYENLKKSDFIEQKIKNIEVIDKCSKYFKNEIDIKMQLINDKWPEKRIFITKFSDIFLS